MYITFEKATVLNAVTMYEKASHFSDALSEIPSGAEVDVICKAEPSEWSYEEDYDEKYEWYAVQYNGKSGYILASDIGR